MGRYLDTETMLLKTPMELWTISELYEHQSNLGEYGKRNANPFYVFLYLIGYNDKTGYLPYDYAPADNLAYAELQLLSKALMTYSLNASGVEKWLDELLELANDEATANFGN